MMIFLGRFPCFLKQAVARATAAGVDEKKIILDPGIGFGKTVAHNLTLLRKTAAFSDLGRAHPSGPLPQGLYPDPFIR